MINALNHTLTLPNIPDYLHATLEEKKPHINLLPENIDLRTIERPTLASPRSMNWGTEMRWCSTMCLATLQRFENGLSTIKHLIAAM